MKMKKFVDLFGRSRGAIIGMIHLRALPGSPKAVGSFHDVINTACSEAEIYKKANVDGVIIENMHDRPWQKPDEMGPETVACMTAACQAVRGVLPDLPMGVQALSACNKEALAIAKATGLNFIRAEGYVFSHIGDKGPIHSCAADLSRYRKMIDAEDIQIFTDVKKKHCSHAITSDISIAETARAAELFLSNGIVVSGAATALPTDPKDIQDVQDAVGLPVLVGSGVTIDNLHKYISTNGIIIGSYLKEFGQWSNQLDKSRVKDFMAKVNKLRGQPEKQDTTADRSSSQFRNIISQGE